jgi:hypothetical protein
MVLEKQMELMQTPEDTAKKIMNYVLPQINNEDVILEPFLGHGNIFNEIREPKLFCDTKDGINFFDFDKKVDYAISNPPFQILEDGEPKNAFILIINRLMEICNKGFFLLINHKLWSSLTVKRLRDWDSNNWVISKIKIYEIKKWYGRYYLVKFEKNGDSLIDYA